MLSLTLAHLIFFSGGAIWGYWLGRFLLIGVVERIVPIYSKVSRGTIYPNSSGESYNINESVDSYLHRALKTMKDRRKESDS